MLGPVLELDWVASVVVELERLLVLIRLVLELSSGLGLVLSHSAGRSPGPGGLGVVLHVLAALHGNQVSQGTQTSWMMHERV